MTHAYRCSHKNCRKRVTLARRKEKYFREPRCGECRRPLKGKEDLAMRERDKHRTCKCSGYMFPHSKTSLWCEQSKKRPSDADYEMRYGSAA